MTKINNFDFFCTLFVFTNALFNPYFSNAAAIENPPRKRKIVGLQNCCDMTVAAVLAGKGVTPSVSGRILNQTTIRGIINEVTYNGTPSNAHNVETMTRREKHRLANSFGEISWEWVNTFGVSLTLSNIGTKKKINPRIAAKRTGNLFMDGNSSVTEILNSKLLNVE